jgi:hypothetical protein
MLWAELRFRKVDAPLSRDLEWETMSKLSLRSFEPLLRLPLAVFSILLLCLSLGDARLRLRLTSGIG